MVKLDKKGNVVPERTGVDTVLLYYLYNDMDTEEVNRVCAYQKDTCKDLELMGRIRVTPEGLNGTLDGSKGNVEEYMTRMDVMHGAGKIDWKLATYPGDCVRRFQGRSIKVKEEVVALHLDEKRREEMMKAGAGEHLSAEEWHKELANPSDNLVVIDVRNYYETRIGRFEFKKPSPSGDTESTETEKKEVSVPAVDPNTRQFSDFANYVDEHVEDYKNKKVLMYCTGGVRCERASAYLRAKVAEVSSEIDSVDSEGKKKDPLEVYQLFGGIHAYQEQFGDKGFFKGKNFVYDPRVAVRASDTPVSQPSNPNNTASASASASASLPEETGLMRILKGIFCFSPSDGVYEEPPSLDVPTNTSTTGNSNNNNNGDGGAFANGTYTDRTVQWEDLKEEIVGQCMLCQDPWEDYTSPYDEQSAFQTRCSYCRTLLLVCDQCKGLSEETRSWDNHANRGLPDPRDPALVKHLKSLLCEMCVDNPERIKATKATEATETSTVVETETEAETEVGSENKKQGQGKKHANAEASKGAKNNIKNNIKNKDKDKTLLNI